VKQSSYKLVINNGGKTSEASAPTIIEALEKVKMTKFVGKISAVVSHGDKAYTFPLLRPFYFRKVLEFPQYKQLFEKRAKQFLGEI